MPILAHTQIRAALLRTTALTAPAAPFVGSGDVKSGAYAYWSVGRAYSLAYAQSGGAAMDLVDQAGSNPVTINVKANGRVDVAALSAWVVANSVTTIRVKKLYDMSGNGRHVTQATLANMPELLLSHPGLGSDPNLPTMKFVNASANALASAATGLSTAAGTFSFVARVESLATSTNGIVQAGTFGAAFAAGTGIQLYAGSTPTTSCIPVDNFACVQTVFNGASSFVVGNGIAGATVNAGSNPLGSPFTIAKWNNGFSPTGNISEIRFDNSAWSAADCIAEYANQKSFWFNSANYEGLVASRCRVQLTNDTTNLYSNSRSAHIAAQNITSLRIGTRNGSGSGSATITASIEYPAGTFTQLKFLGASSVTLGPTVECFSDYCSVTIPAGATFWYREFWNGTSAGRTFYNTWQNSFLGEATELSATVLTDKTMSGTITNSGTPSGVSRPPRLIVGVTNLPSVCIVGDSIGYGQADVEDSSASATGYNGVVGYIARSISVNGAAFTNLAIPGTIAQSQVPGIHNGKCSHLISNFGINDLSGSRTSAQLIADISANISLFAGPRTKFYQTTITPKTTSSDGWITTANQSSFLASLDTNRVLFNNALRAGTTGISRLTGFYDGMGSFESGLNSNKWAVSPTPPYTGDGTHPSQSAHTLVVASGVIPAPQWP